ncbi:hypothetical protein BH11MYX1_BH11MYX1_21410 [soil metagenome]
MLLYRPGMKLVVALVAVSACASAPGEVGVNDRLTVIDQAVQVEPNRLTLPRAGNDALLESQAGDILVSGQGAGFLRKVKTVAVSGDDLVIETDQAAMTDAINEAEYAEVIHDAKWDVAGPHFAGVQVGFGNVDVQGNGGAHLKMTRGSVGFSPTLDLAMKMHWAHISQFDLVAQGAFDAELGFHLETTGAAELHYTKDLWESPAMTFYQQIGIVPVVEVVQVHVALEVDIATEGKTSLDVGASAHSQLAVGARYRNGHWTRVNDHTLVLRTDAPVLTTTNGVEVTVKVPVELSVSFYDLAGPSVGLEPYVKAAYVPSEGPRVVASWGTEGVFAGTVNLLGTGDDSRVLGFEESLFDFNCEFGTPVAECLK